MQVAIDEQIADRCLDQRAHPHGAQVIDRGSLESRLQSRDLAGIGKLIHLSAANEILEDRASLARNDGADDGAVREIRELHFFDLESPEPSLTTTRRAS